MINYARWKERRERISNLFIDSQNPRIPHIYEQNQNDLINVMVEKYRVLDLAKSIANEGFFPDKNLIGISSRNKKVIILEGNRRISAIKCLLNPEIVLSRRRKQFEVLKSIIEPSFIQFVNVVIAPSREEADPIIFKEHTQNTSMKWSPIMQAEFYVGKVKSGLDIDTLEERHHLKKGEVLNHLKMYNMYNLVCSLDYEDTNTKAKVLDKQNFPATTLERVYGTTNMRNFLGIEFTPSGNIRGKKDKKQFAKAMSVIVSDIVNNKATSRSLNETKDRKRYLSKLKSLKPTKNGRFTLNDFLKDEDNKPFNEPADKKPTQRTSKESSSIIPSGIPFKLEAAANLKECYKELRKLPVKTYPNSTAVALRVFLDKSLRMYIKKQNIKKIEKKVKNSVIAAPLSELKLGEIIDHLIRKDVKIIDDDNIKKALKRFKTSGDPNTSLAGLNASIHNEEFSLSANEVRTIWKSLEGLFRIILKEPN